MDELNNIERIALIVATALACPFVLPTIIGLVDAGKGAKEEVDRK